MTSSDSPNKHHGTMESCPACRPILQRCRWMEYAGRALIVIGLLMIVVSLSR